MLYIINFDIKDPEREEKFHKVIKGFGDVNFFMSKCLLLDATNPVATKEEIFIKLREFLQDGDTFLITSVKFEGMAGWLNSNAIEWLKNHK